MDEVSDDLGSRNMPGMSKTPGVSGMPVVQALVMDGSWLGGVGGASDHIAFLGPPNTPLAPPSLILALTLVQLSSIPPILTIVPCPTVFSETLSQPALPIASLLILPYRSALHSETLPCPTAKLAQFAAVTLSVIHPNPIYTLPPLSY
jgi:hypothetical protein